MLVGKKVINTCHPPQVFILVGAGIVGGIGLIIVEIIYHKHKLRRAKRTETAKIAFTRWKGTIEVRTAAGLGSYTWRTLHHYK